MISMHSTDPNVPTAKFSVLDPASGCSVLQTILRKPLSEDIDYVKTEAAEAKYEKCLDAILSRPMSASLVAEIRQIINKKDVRGNTALHYATQVRTKGSFRPA